jgi:ribosomal protein S18 acetylase RimI-like enzyme
MERDPTIHPALTPPDEIRQAGTGDAAEVARMLHAFNSEFGDPTPGVGPLTRRAAELIGAGEVVELLAGDPPFGFAQLRFLPSMWSDGYEAYLEELYIAPDRRGEGFGRRLLDAAIELSRARGSTHLQLNTSEDDTAARALYESAGFSNREGDPNGPPMFFYELEL